ncbi:MAG: hypothetical protein H7328_06525 [Bdellovibrio sp.]|nr:hypothetical protein [Bdellovibrio sp.]
MNRMAVLPLRGSDIEIDIYSNKSSLILFWLLAYHIQIQKDGFSINELSRLTGTSIGLVHKVVKQLEYIGIITSKGLRTNKKFYLKYPDKLLIDWIKEYNLIKKTKTKGFAFFDRKSNAGKLNLVPALHTASAEYFNLKTTNLRPQEYYLLNWDRLAKISNQLSLVELDRGYEVLLIKPYYSALIERVSSEIQKEIWMKPYAFLTVLDLLHFPVRGIEQAEALFRKMDDIKSICSWREIENAIR